MFKKILLLLIIVGLVAIVAPSTRAGSPPPIVITVNAVENQMSLVGSEFAAGQDSPPASVNSQDVILREAINLAQVSEKAQAMAIGTEMAKSAQNRRMEKNGTAA